MTDQATYPEMFARLAQIKAEIGTLHDEWDRLRAAMVHDGNARAQRAMAEAGFVFEESIISCARGDSEFGVLDHVNVEHAPFKPDDKWTFRILYQPMLKSGKPRRGRDEYWLFVASPEDLPSLFKITGTAERQRPKVAGATA